MSQIPNPSLDKKSFNVDSNPLLHPYSAGTIPFDKILVHHYIPAIEEAIRIHNEEINDIINNPQTPDFENTIVAFEQSGLCLDHICLVFFNLLECNGTDEMLQLSEQIQSIVTEHTHNITLNEALFDRIALVWKQKEALSLDDEQSTLLKNTYDYFARHGATLVSEQRNRWKEINTELDTLSLRFSQNCLRSTHAYQLLLTQDSEVDGLPDFLLESMKGEASRADQQGWLVTLQAPCYRPFMTYAKRRDLREKLYRAYHSRASQGEFSNQEIIRRIVELRREKALLMEHTHFASYQLEDKMAKDAPTVIRFLHKLLDAYRPQALKDIRELEAFARSEEKDPDFILQPWDVQYYSERLKKERYDVSDELLKPYFPLPQVVEGIFGLAHTLYGLTFDRKSDIPLYHPDVEVYEVKDKNGHIGLLYTDFFPRTTKQSGAWMTEFKEQWKDADGKDNRPHISIVMNFTPPLNGQPALLTFDEVGTFLHEFGHALHGLLSRCTYRSLSGTHVAHDFVELPSQFMENYLTKKEFLVTFARHYQTQETIPDTLIDRIIRAKNFQAGYLCLRQLTFGLLDMAFHMQTAPLDSDFDLTDFERQATADTQILPTITGTWISCTFSHIFSGGYAAGYYGYKWSEVLDADAFAVFEKEGIFCSRTASRFRHLLERGGTISPDLLYRNFKGSAPSIEALMHRDGIENPMHTQSYTII